MVPYTVVERDSEDGTEGGDLHTVPFTAVEGDPEDGTFKLRPEGKEAAMGKVEQAEGQHVWRFYTGTGLFSSGNERWLLCVGKG